MTETNENQQSLNELAKSENQQMNIVESSPLMRNKKHRGLKRDWPWQQLECGQSFVVSKDDIKIETLRPMCSQKGRSFNPIRKFRVVEHTNFYEVGRIK